MYTGVKVRAGLCLLLAIGTGAMASSPGPQDDLRPGLIGEYHSIRRQMRAVPAPSPAAKPPQRRIDAVLDFDTWANSWPKGVFADFTYVRWSGFVRIPLDGEYAFYTEADDGSLLYIDGKLIADNDGSHALDEDYGYLRLKAGRHRIVIDYFQNQYRGAIKVYWKTPGAIAKELIPAEALFHRKDPHLDKE